MLVFVAKRYKAILFDAGDTLIHLSRPFPEIMKEVLAEHGLDSDLDALAEATEEVFLEAEEARANTHSGTQSSDADAEAYWTSLYAEVGKRARVPGFERRHAEAVYAYILGGQPFAPAEGAAELLAWCREQGYRLGLVSNWSSDLPGLLDRLGLAPPFDTVVVSALVGMEKPNPRIFLRALHDLGVKASDALHVGDDYYNDGMGAWAIGIDPLLLDRFDRYGRGEFPRVARLSEVRAYLERLA